MTSGLAAAAFASLPITRAVVINPVPTTA